MTSAPDDKKYDRRLCLILIVVLAIGYAALQNGRWVPVSDGDFYVPLARNIARGEGYYFNRQPVKVAPPGWPVLVAAAMRVWPSFWLINLLPMACSLAAAGLWYRVLRRLGSARRSFLVVLVSALLFWSYHLTVVLHSEALFGLLLAAAVLLAFQINERKALGWRLPLLLAVCAALPLARWIGLLSWLIVGGVLLSGQLRPRLNRHWISFVLSTAVIVGVFVAARRAVDRPAPPPPSGPTTQRAAPAPVPVASSSSFAVMPRIDVDTYLGRLSRSGMWVADVLWMPCQVGISWGPLGLVANVVGWCLIGLYVVALLRGARRRQWVWVGVFLYCGALCLRWRWVNARYLITLTPFLILAILMGLDWLSGLARSRPWRTSWRAARASFVGSLLACNLALMAVDVWIARSRDFHGRYYGGQAKGVIAAARWLNQRRVADGELAVSKGYVNIGRRRLNGFGLNAMILLTDRLVLYVPGRVCNGPPNRRLLKWAGREGVRYYLYRPPVSPWRVWHFRMPWLQRTVTGKPVAENPYWELYELKDGAAVRVDLPVGSDSPRRVPGM